MTTDLRRLAVPGLRELARDQAGQTIVLLAVSIPLLMALLLLVIDGGRLLVHRERLHGAAQLAAYAGVSAMSELPPGQQRDTERTRSSIDPVIREALLRNLPGTPFTYTFDMPSRDARSGGELVVHLSSPFAASIQRITFGIGATGTVSTAPAPATPTPRLVAPPAQLIAPTPRPTPTQAAPAPTPLPTQPAVAIQPQATPTPVPTPSPWTPSILATMTLASDPAEVVVGARSVFVAGRAFGTGAGQLITVDAALRRPQDSLPLANNPYGVTVDPARKRAYISHILPGQLTVVDTTSGRIVAEIPLPGYRGQKVAFDPETGRVFVSAFCDSVSACSDYAVFVFDPLTYRRAALITIKDRPVDLLVDPGRKRVYAYEQFARGIAVIDTVTNTVKRRIELPSQVLSLTLDVARDRVYAIDPQDAYRVLAFDGTTGRLVARIELPPNAIRPTALTIDPSSGRIYVSAVTADHYDPATRRHTIESSLFALEGETGRVIGSGKVSGGEIGKLVFDPEADRLYMTQGRQLSMLKG